MLYLSNPHPDPNQCVSSVNNCEVKMVQSPLSVPAATIRAQAFSSRLITALIHLGIHILQQALFHSLYFLQALFAQD